jgi:hypothetical protein
MEYNRSKLAAPLLSKWRPRRAAVFDPLAWAAIAFLLLYAEASMYWLLLVVAIWVGVRILVFRRRCINEGIWQAENSATGAGQRRLPVDSVRGRRPAWWKRA